MLTVQRIADFENLKRYQQQWDGLAGDDVFLSWTWLSTWWKHYGDSNDLHLLLFFDESSGDLGPESGKRLVGILPTYIQQNLAKGRVLSLLGDGEVCSDHLEIIAAEEDKLSIAVAAAQYFVENANLWDVTYFNAIGRDCEGLMGLAEALEIQGCKLTLTPNVGCWTVSLPEDWESFLAMQSKSHRKKLRRLDRGAFGNENSEWFQVETKEDFEKAWPILIDLHQRRRNSLDEPGCFASETWADFHKDVAQQLLLQDKLRLSWLELDGTPVAAEYQFASRGSTHAYQSGLDPDRMKHQPGRLSLMRTIQQAIEDGQQVFDFMRGDEPYKLQWKAEPIETVDIRVVSPSLKGRLRNQAFTYAKSLLSVARTSVLLVCGLS